MATHESARRQFLKSAAVAPFCLTRLHSTGRTSEDSIRKLAVSSTDGIPTLLVDGTAVRSAAFETYAPNPRHFQQFAAVGTEVFGFSTNAAACDYGHSQATWVDQNSWDYSQFEERAAMILAARPQALLLPRVNLGTPRWWLEQEENANELERFDDGSTIPRGEHPTLPRDRGFPSFASQKWRAEIGDALQRLIWHVRDSRFGPHVIGWVLAGGHTEEWYHWCCHTPRPAGYSDPTCTAFRRWLSVKYQNDQTLQEAWNDPQVTLTTARVPTAAERNRQGESGFRDPATQMNVIDFYLFWNELLPDTIAHFAQVVKRASDGKHVAGAFYGYMYEFAGDPEFGHNAVARLARCSDLDFMAVTASYFNRQSASGSDYQRSPAYSLALHGKLWYHDNDVVSYRAKQRMLEIGFTAEQDWTRNLELQLKSLGYTETPAQSHWMYRRGWGFAVAHGMHLAWFDLHGGYFDAPDLMHEIKRLNTLASNPSLNDRKSIAQILVVADESSCAYANPRSEFLKRTLTDSQNQLTRIGAPCDHVLLDDLHLVDPTRYRLVVFLNCYHVNQQQRASIERFKRGGRHLLWYGVPGWFSDHRASLAGIEELTGHRITPTSKLMSRRSSDTVTDSGNDTFVAAEHVTLRRRLSRDWTSYYAHEVPVAAQVVRSVARESKVHLFNEADDVLYANASLVVLHASINGQRVVRFPGTVNVIDLVNGQSWPETEEVPLSVALGETVLLQWQYQLIR